MSNDETFSEFLTYDQVSQILKVSKNTIRHYVKRKENPLPVIYLNPDAQKNPRIRTEVFKEWMESLEDPRNDV